MSLSRRGFLGLLAGAAASPLVRPVLSPVAKVLDVLIPEDHLVGLSRVLRGYYSKDVIANLKANTPFLAAIQNQPLPFRGGKEIQFFTYHLGSPDNGQES